MPEHFEIGRVYLWRHGDDISGNKTFLASARKPSCVHSVGYRV